MKKRDFYILGLLFCVIVYASFHRKAVVGNEQVVRKEILVPKAKSGVEAVKVDTLEQKAERVVKAGI